MASTRETLARGVRPRCFPSCAGNSTSLIGRTTFGISMCLPEIAWKGYEGIARGNTAFGSTISTEFAFPGMGNMPTKSKSRTTTERLGYPLANSRTRPPVARRLPTHRPPTHPGAMLLEEFFKPLAVSQAAFAIRLGVSYPRLNEIVRGKRSVTSDTALRLAQVLGTSPDFWLGLQQDWDLWHTMHSAAAEEIRYLLPIRRKGRGAAGTNTLR